MGLNKDPNEEMPIAYWAECGLMAKLKQSISYAVDSLGTEADGAEH